MQKPGMAVKLKEPNSGGQSLDVQEGQSIFEAAKTSSHDEANASTGAAANYNLHACNWLGRCLAG